MRPIYCPSMKIGNWLVLLYAEDAAFYEGLTDPLCLRHALWCYNEAVRYGMVFA